MSGRRVVVGQMCRRGSAEEKEFNSKFWESVTPEVKFASAWEMVGEVHHFKGGADACESRLQRSVQNIQRRRC